MELFKGKNLLEFAERFKTDLDCKEYLAKLKWKNSFYCVKCGHKGSQKRADHSRTCNKCSHTESATANTQSWRKHDAQAKCECLLVPLLPPLN